MPVTGLPEYYHALYRFGSVQSAASGVSKRFHFSDFYGIDRADNFYFSNLTLWGINIAYLPVSVGIYIDGSPAATWWSKGLAMVWSGDCVGGVGAHNLVTVRDNLDQALKSTRTF